MATVYATHRPGLNDTKPANTELVAEGDDHLRLLKNVLQTTFPGRGVTDMAPITKTINFVPGVNEVGALYVINGATTCTMPVASGLPTGTHYWIWTPSAPLTLATSDGTLINGAVGATVPTLSGMIITYNGTGWILMRVGPGAPGADGAGIGIGLTENTWAGDNTSISATVSQNTAFGYNALLAAEGNGNVAVGARALEDAAGTNGNVAIGAKAAQNVTGDVLIEGEGVEGGGICIGYEAAAVTTTTADAVVIGRNAAGASTSILNGGVLIGRNAAAGCTSPGQNIAIGKNSMASGVSGYENLAIGISSLRDLGSTSAVECRQNVAVGHNAMVQTITGEGNVALGTDAMRSADANNFCTALGRSSLYTTANRTNCTGLGYDAEVTGSNQVQLGNSSTTTYAYGAVANRSDARDKTDVRSTSLGLAFILALRPVEFRWDYREDYGWGKKDGSKTRSRFHQGFIAQDVKKVLEEQRVDFGGFQDHSIAAGKDVMSLGYTEFIAPLVKAIQELAAEFAEYKRTHP